MIRKLFKADQPSGQTRKAGAEVGALLADTVHARVERTGAITIATVKASQLTERESKALIDDVTTNLGEGVPRLVIDLAEVHLLASAGIGALVQIHNNANKAGGKVAVCNLSDEITSLMKLTRLDKLFTLAADRDAALKAVT